MNNDSLYSREVELLAQAKNFFVDLSDKLVIFFNSYQWQEILFALKFAAFIVSVLLLVLIVIVFIKKTRL